MIAIVSYASGVQAPATCTCCNEVKTERGVMVSSEYSEAVVYRFVCGTCPLRVRHVPPAHDRSVRGIGR